MWTAREHAKEYKTQVEGAHNIIQAWQIHSAIYANSVEVVNVYNMN